MNTDILNSFSQDILIKLKEDSLVPLPNNFYNYFDNMLENKDEEFKNEVLDMIELDSGTSSSDYLHVESKIKQNNNSFKELLQNISDSFKKLNLLDKHSNIVLKKLEQSNSSDEIVELLSQISQIISNNEAGLKSKIKDIQSKYIESAKGVKSVFEDSIYDPKYQLFNSRYLQVIVKKEIESIQSFIHDSVLIALKVDSSILDTCKDDKAQTILNKTISKLILKVTRRSDFIFHYQNGTFVILFKNMGLDGAKATSNRLQTIVKESTFFIGENEVDLKLSIGIFDIDTSISAEENIKFVVQATVMADNSDQMAHIVLDRSGEVSV